MITPGQSFAGKVGVPFTATPSASGLVSLWRASNLPDGLSLNPTTGLITGTPVKKGIFNSTFSDKPFAIGVLNGGTSLGSYGFSYHAIKPDGTVVGFGSNQSGVASVPEGLTDVVQITRSLALKSDGTVVGIGYVTAPEGLTNVAALGKNAVLKKDGTIFAWGANDYGQANAPAGSDFVAIASGVDWHVALRSNGTLVGWGRYHSGLLDTTDITGVTAISAGSYFYLTLDEDGVVNSRAGSSHLDYIWGYSDPNLKAVAIAADSQRSLILLEDGRVYRRGENNYESTQGIVPNLSGVVGIGVGNSFSAVKNDGSVVRWGETLQQNSPIAVTGIIASTVSRGGNTAEFTISEGAPIIESAQTFQGLLQKPFSSTVKASDSINRPVISWTASGLPAGLSINSETGGISGVPEVFGSFDPLVSVSGPGGTDEEYISITIEKTPQIYSAQTRAASVYAGASKAVGVYFGQNKIL